MFPFLFWASFWAKIRPFFRAGKNLLNCHPASRGKLQDRRKVAEFEGDAELVLSKHSVGGGDGGCGDDGGVGGR